MKVIIIEDEQYAADALAVVILELQPEAKVMAKLGSVEESLSWFRQHGDPELIFCDIHLSDGSSFQIFQHIEVKCPVVFTTAYNQYAIDAFQVNSIDYLLKPIKTEEVAKALRKYASLRQYQFIQEFTKVQSLIKEGKFQFNQQQHKARFIVKSGQAIKTIPCEEAAYFLAEKGVVFLITFGGKRFIINFTLDQLEEQLDKRMFFRANRQLIIHVKAIKEVRPYFKGRFSLLLQPTGPAEIIVSNSKAASFKDWLDL